MVFESHLCHHLRFQLQMVTNHLKFHRIFTKTREQERLQYLTGFFHQNSKRFDLPNGFQPKNEQMLMFRTKSAFHTELNSSKP